MAQEGFLDSRRSGWYRTCEGDTAHDMEINVWNQQRWFVLVVTSVLSLSTFSTAALRPRNLTLSYDVRGSDVASTSTFKTTQENQEGILRITRQATATGESRVGVLAYEGHVLCYTLEHESVKIPTGRYAAELRWSERFGETVVYIHVPNRSGIEIHRGNCPVDSGGCVLVGTTIDGACLDNSKQAFERMVKVLPQEFTVIVE